MSPWMLVLTGFVAFPVTVVAVAWLIARLQRVTPLEVRDPAQLQSLLRELLGEGPPIATVFLRDVETKLLIRINKYVRRRDSHTLGLELRRTDSGVELYRKAREAIRGLGLEFAEELTPKRRLPRRLRLLHEDGGPFSITFIERVVSAIHDALHPGRPFDLLASDRQPELWVRGRHTRPRPELEATRR